MPLQHFLLVIPHGGSRSGGGEANEFLHSLNLPKFRYVVESSLEDGWNSDLTTKTRIQMKGGTAPSKVGPIPS